MKIGLAGVGHLGKIHLKCLLNIPEWTVSGIYDADAENAKKVGEEYGVHVFSSFNELLEASDAVDLVTPTTTHFELARQVLKSRKHLFIEKPVTHTLQEARKLQKLYAEAEVKVQVGHVERFNPAFLAVKDQIKNPMFIEAHRLAEFNPRGTDVPVVLDLMIHDIDVVLAAVQSPVKKISASGVAVISDTPDITNARIEFLNGAVANLTASRISMKKMRKMRIFQRDAYISVDFLTKESEVISLVPENERGKNPFALTLTNAAGETKELEYSKPEIKPLNAIEEELKSFYYSIVNKTTEEVPLDDGVSSLEVAHEILQKIRVNLSMIQ
ncbi:Gfo/Idh/MocA family protein [Thermaurantimonas aggregans]|uniref:Gfo/Idh/MocA family protein n=1 Tax=Thermaurantimonas aggregans TaxID=2173829 RepID=UPI0023F28A7E|nr:Gfo/Idh/MocA family oxidoreductase [Thermaurantimonas aggregans]MCX8148680.1 Gfo/Idh/MocA family oxidoreductase [Thermaurantimonas aggregans]